MIQQYDKYSEEDHAVWKILFERQVENLGDKACATFLNTLAEMKEVLHGDRIPNFIDLSSYLESKTGWTIEVVKGLIPIDEFFALLAVKKFPASTWLRKRSQLDYLEEPDMFHDIFGHIPLLTNTEYADIMHQMGLMCIQKNYEASFVQRMERFYWFTIEFGLIQENEARKIYGAGILSSFGESKVIYDATTKVQAFDVAQVLNHDFTKSELQQEYFEIDSISDLPSFLKQCS